MKNATIRFVAKINKLRVEYYQLLLEMRGMTMATQTFTAILHKEDDLYVAECPEVGTVSQGSTIEEAIANLKEATQLYLEEFPLPETTRPLLTTFEVATHAKVA